MASYNHSALIAASLTAVYPLYLLGALYIVYPLLAWYLLVKLLIQRLRGTAIVLHPIVILWLLCMFGMLVILLVGHIDWQFGAVATLKSTVGWAKGWALMAVFLVAGALLTDRQQLVRAACIVGRWTLFIAPVLLLAFALGLPDTLYVSPLKVLGGSTAEYFTISLYELDPGFGVPRLRLFAPWAPAIGLIGNLLLLLSILEPDPRLRFQGIAGALLMIVLSLSRLGWIVALVVPGLLFVLSNLRDRRVWILGGVLFAFFAVLGLQAIDLISVSFDQLKNARADSTMVRQTLADIAIVRWWDEAPWWGHGRVEAGPHLVQYMMIGSHHTWYGLLFVKGAAGALALALPLLASLLCLLRAAATDAEARTAFCLLAVLALYSFGENLEVLPYLYWPALVYIGSVFHSLEGQDA